MDRPSEPRRRGFSMGACLGRGGFGEVYRATMTSPTGLQSVVAVKVLRADVGVHSEAVVRLRDEARMLARLNHPAVLQVHDLVQLEGRVALVMEFVEGADLAEVFVADDRPGTRVVLEAVAEVASALAGAYATPGHDGRPMQLVHRDIKPTNIRVGWHGQVKLLDFGIATAENVAREARTASGLVVGSLPYMAPERFTAREAHPANDVFGLGCTLFEALSAGRRFYGEARMRDVSALAVAPERFARFLQAALDSLEPLPDGIRSLLADTLAWELADRPGARELAARCEALGERLGGLGIKTWARERRWPDPEVHDGPLAGRSLEEGTLPGSREVPRSELAQEVPDPAVPVSALPEPPIAGPPSRADRPWTEENAQSDPMHTVWTRDRPQPPITDPPIVPSGPGPGRPARASGTVRHKAGLATFVGAGAALAGVVVVGIGALALLIVLWVGLNS